MHVTFDVTQPLQKLLKYILIGILGTLCLYITALKRHDMKNLGVVTFFTSFWTYFDIAPPLIILFYIYLDLTGGYVNIGDNFEIMN